MGKRLGATIGGLLLVSACGTTAEIHTRDARVLRGKITGGDAHSITLAGGATIPRTEILDIDHPGNGAAITGYALIVYGGINMLLVADQLRERNYDDDDEARLRVYGAIPLAVGVGLALWGTVIWYGSTSAAERGLRPATTANPPDLALTPFAIPEPDGDGAIYGATVGGRF